MNTAAAPHRRSLRSGFTTGTAAAAATKAALETVLGDRPPSSVYIPFLSVGGVEIPVHRIERCGPQTAICTVIKDGGDDPDITHRAEIGARVTIGATDAADAAACPIVIEGGEGVGRVTKPGLAVAPGGPAINEGPRRMIQDAVRAVLAQRERRVAVQVEIFVPEGRRLALKTLNNRLGIVGGISILGTTGIVRPLSHDAYTATIHAALSVAAAAGQSPVVMSTGRRSERFAQTLFATLTEEAFVQIGDHFRFALQTAAALGVTSIVLTAFFGKALKMAQGAPHTHAAKASLALTQLAAWTRDLTDDTDLAAALEKCNTAREAFARLYPKHPVVVVAVGREILRHARFFTSGSAMAIDSLIFDFEGRPVYDSRQERARG